MLRRFFLLLPFCAVLVWAVGASRADSGAEDMAYLSVRLGEVLELEPTGKSIDWSNPATGNSGTIVVTRTYFVAAGKPCREYRRTTDRADEPPVVMAGTGCRIGDGRWRLSEAGRGETMSTEVPAGGDEAAPAAEPTEPTEAAEEPETTAEEEVPRVVPPKPAVPVITDASRPTRSE